MRPPSFWCQLAESCALSVGVLCALGACKDNNGPERFNQPVIGAPMLKAHTPSAPLDAGPAAVVEERLPEEAALQFAKLADMERSPRWAPFAELIRASVKGTYSKNHGGKKRKPPHDIAITQYFIKSLPEVYGVDFLTWCGASYGGGFSVVEHHLLVVREDEKLRILSAHKPACGVVGDRSVFFVDLLSDNKDELIEVYIEDNPVSDDSQEIRVFALRGGRLQRVAEIRHASPLKFFHHEFRKGRGQERDIVTTHVEIEKVLARLRNRPCFVYRYFEIETTYRYNAAGGEFTRLGATRKRLPQNVALDLSGGDAPEGSCGG